MRTTVDLPSDLMRAAKARAAAEGRSLKDLLERAVAREIEAPPAPTGHERVRLPLIGSVRPHLEVTNEALENFLDDDDVEEYGGR